MYFFTDIFEKIIEMSVQASIAVFIVLIIRAVLKLIKAPKIFLYIIWIIPFIRLVCPVALESSFSVMPRAIYEYKEEQAENIDTEGVVDNISINNSNYDNSYDYQIDTEITDNVSNYENIVEEDGNNILYNDTYKENPSQIKKNGDEDDKWATPGILDVFSVCWITGVIFVLVQSVISLNKFKKKLKDGEFIFDNVYSSDFVDTAFVIGLFKPRIYVPSDIEAQELSYVVAHEKYHIKRLDYIIKPVAYFVTSIHWFNPLAWLAYYLLEKDMEMSCDEAVLRKLGYDNKKNYAEALLKLSFNRRFVSSVPTAFGEGNTKDRVKNVMNIKKPLTIVGIVAVVVVCILGITLLTDPKKKDSDTATVTDAIVVNESDVTSIPVGKYVLNTEYQEVGTGNVCKYVPCVQIFDDGTAAFSYDPLSSYYPYSSEGYVINDGKLSFTTDKDRRFTFSVKEEDGRIKLIFDESDSYKLKITDEDLVYKVENESTFLLAEEKTKYEANTNSDSEKMYQTHYDVVKEISYNQATILDDMILGSDGIILDYADDEKVIFHGYAGLFIYDLIECEISSSINLEDIGASATQGDKAYIVEVTSGGEYVYIKPVVYSDDSFETVIYDDGAMDYNGYSYNDAMAYSYDVKAERLYQSSPRILYVEDLFHTKRYGSGNEDYHGSGFASLNYIDFDDGHGYIICPTGLWKDTCYVRGDMVYTVFDK